MEGEERDKIKSEIIEKGKERRILSMDRGDKKIGGMEKEGKKKRSRENTCKN